MSTQEVAAPSPSGTTAPAPSAPAPTSGAESRAAARSADYETGAAMLSPSGPPASTYNVAGKGDYGPGKDDKFFDPKKQTKWGTTTAWGYGWGNRADDLDDPVEKTPAKNKTVDSGVLSGIPEPELDKLARTHKEEVAGPYGTYRGYEVAEGEAHATDVGATLGHKLGKSDDAGVSGPLYQAGRQARAYAGIKGAVANDHGSLTGKAEGHGRAYYGASGKSQLSFSQATSNGKRSYGMSAEGAVGAGAEIGANAQADAKSAGYQMAGVDAPLDVGIGVGAAARAYAKAGAGLGAHLSSDKIGVTGAAGVGAVSEVKADVHGNVGPLKGKYEAGLMAGAGAGLEGAIIYEGGKLVIGGRAYAAIGYGASAGLSMSVDVKQSYQMTAAVLKKAAALGIRGAKEAFEAADRDHDGKLSLNDAATQASSAMDKGARKVERGVDGAIAFLDGDGDGKFDLRKDAGARLTQAKDAAADGGRRALDAGGKLVDSAKEAVGDAASGVGKAVGDAASGVAKAADGAASRAHKAVDVNADGKLTTQDARAGYKLAEGWANKKVTQGFDWAKQKKDEALALGNAKLAEAEQIAKAAHKLADRSGDGRLGSNDVTQGMADLYDAGKAAGAKAGEMGGQAVDLASKKAGEAITGAKGVAKKAHAAADRDGDGKLGTADVAKAAGEAKGAVLAKGRSIRSALGAGFDAAMQTIDSVRSVADLNKDKSVDLKDGGVAYKEALAVASEAKAKSEAALKAAQASIARLEAQALSTIDRAKQAADLDKSGDLGFGDIKEGAVQGYRAARDTAGDVKSAVADGAKAGFKAASEGLSRAGDTLATGYTDAAGRVGGALGRFSSFVRGR